jgi:hypothetical protein
MNRPPSARLLPALAALVLTAAPAAGQSLYLNQGASGSTVAFSYVQADDYNVLGAEFGFAHRGVTDFGVQVGRLETDDTGLGELRGTQVAPFLAFHVAKQDAESPVSIQLGVQYSHVWYSGRPLDQRTLDMSEDSIGFAGVISTRMPARSGADFIPFAQVVHTRGSVSIENQYGHTEEIDDQITAYGVGFGLLFNNAFYVTPAILASDDQTVVSLTVGILKRTTRF